jgi:hypothetical protein
LPEDISLNLTGLRPSDPLAIILKPLKKRFQFHFTGNKKTNNPEKPEWYLQQVNVQQDYFFNKIRYLMSRLTVPLC